MLFSEIYGSYFNVVAAVLKEAGTGALTDSRLGEIIMEKAFSESILSIPQGLKEEWALLNNDLTTPIKNEPEMPLTILQKRWLKALLDDPRIKLFGGIEDGKGLEDIEPLFTRDMIVEFDQYDDGDPYESKKYIDNFRTILEAFRQKRKIFIHFTDYHNRTHRWECVPYWLEYSAKDDKFRLITGSRNEDHILSINLARIKKCDVRDYYTDEEYDPPEIKQGKLIMEIVDERNALERVMLHFSHLAKETEKIDNNRYRLTLNYDKEDETEILIRVLSFGPLVKVVSPDSFISNIKERVNKQNLIPIPF